MQALSVSIHVLQVQRFSVCYRVRDAMTADTGAGVGIVTVGPGLVGTMKVVADSRAYTAGVLQDRGVRVFRIQGLSVLRQITS